MRAHFSYMAPGMLLETACADAGIRKLQDELKKKILRKRRGIIEISKGWRKRMARRRGEFDTASGAGRSGWVKDNNNNNNCSGGGGCRNRAKVAVSVVEKPIFLQSRGRNSPRAAAMQDMHLQGWSFGSVIRAVYLPFTCGSRGALQRLARAFLSLLFIPSRAAVRTSYPTYGGFSSYCLPARRCTDAADANHQVHQRGINLDSRAESCSICAAAASLLFSGMPRTSTMHTDLYSAPFFF